MPYWLKGGCIAGVIGTVFFLFLPANFSNLADTPRWAGWFMLPAFIIFSLTCVICRIDFISESGSTIHQTLVSALWILTLFGVFFAYGSLIGLIIGLIKSKKKV